jgi:hypothetical protein
MGDFVRQLPTLVGVIVGALASYFVTSASERGRWRREQESRWDENRAQAYADYGYTVKRHYELCKRLASSRGMPTLSEPLDPVQALDELARSSAERAARWERVLLLGSPDTVAAARVWHRSVWQLELFARGLRDDTPGWKQADLAVQEARSKFYAAARRDLGIKSGHLPEGGPWEIPSPTTT